MTLAEARALMANGRDEALVVTIKRSGATWTGKIVGYITEPALILEEPDGRRVPIALHGAAFEKTQPREEDR